VIARVTRRRRRASQPGTVSDLMRPTSSASTRTRPTQTAPLRILHVVAHSHRRGAEIAATELADELERLGHRNRLVALGPALDGGRDPELEPLGRSWREGPVELATLAWRLRRLLSGDATDVVLAHGSWPVAVAALAVPRRGPLLVWQRILGLPDKVWGRVRQRWWATVAHRVNAAVALTDDQAVELRRLGFRGPVWVIPNFRKPDRFRDIDRATAAARLRAELGVPEGVPLIGFVGHLVQQKRVDRALDVLARLGAQGCVAQLVISGAGGLRPELEARAERLGVAGAVTFLGHRNDVEWVFAGVDLALLTSEAEGIPGVGIEALMAGCPMVTVPVGGAADVVKDGVTGVVLDSFEPVAMADAVARLLADDELRAAMSRASRLRVDRFSASTAAVAYAEGLTSLAGR
jgi:glycosyltransferase involved in cell wall biosynthesis